MGQPTDEPSRRDPADGPTFDFDPGRAGPVGPPHAGAADHAGTSADLERALDRLPEPQGLILRLRHREHLDFAEIARRMGLAPAGAQAAWFRALEALARALESGR